MADVYPTTFVIPGFNYGNGTEGLGSAQTSVLEKGFPSSPIFKGEVPTWKEYATLVMRGTADIVDPADFGITGLGTPDGATPSRTYSENAPSNPTTTAAPDQYNSMAGGYVPNIATPAKPYYDSMPPAVWEPTADDAYISNGSGEGGTYTPEAASAAQGGSAPILEDTVTGTDRPDYTLGHWLSTS